ncbi:MAG: biopolymer transporter ExbD [Rhodothermales bacterium]|nr:biopolymer transporter ExbD [Rhodothermales bacterium]
MQRKGYIIRFIDIGLIILFGFLMISDLTVISQIQLPGSEQDRPADPPDDNTRMIGVVIEESGLYRIREMATDVPLFVNVEQIADLEVLVRRLVEEHEAVGGAIEVVIEPHPNAVMQRLVDVHDLCERLGVKKNINTAIGRGGP